MTLKIRCRYASFFVVLLLLASPVVVNGRRFTNDNGDPYRILGVTREATQADIRKSYRQLCLRHHPDKNGHKSARERQRCEEAFKKVQMAYSQIGDPQARQKYDNPMTDLPSFRNSATSGYPFYESTRRYDPYSSFRHSDVFTNSNWFYESRNSLFDLSPSLKSVYIQKFKVPLRDLYRGKPSTHITLKDTLWTHYCAAFRGRIAFLLLYQGFLVSLPLLRFSRWAALAGGVALFHSSIPRPTRQQYTLNLLPGYKGGTKFLFKVEPGFDVVFVLEEEPDQDFTRRGNDLYTRQSVTPQQAKMGCTLRLQSLDQTVLAIPIAPGQIKKGYHELVLKGMGWPIRKKEGEFGDMIVQVNVQAKPRFQRRRKWMR